MNTRPELDPSLSPALPATSPGAAAPTGAVGAVVSSLIGAGVSDVDNDAVGIAVTAIQGGTLYYSNDDGVNWIQAASVSSGKALLLSDTARVYFSPFSGTSSAISDALTFRAWDGTAGSSGNIVKLNGDAVLLTQGANGGRTVASTNDYAIVAGGSSIKVIDLSDASLPVVGNVPISMGAMVTASAAHNGRFYVMTQDMSTGSKLSTFTISGDGTPSAMTSIALPQGSSAMYAIVIRDGMLYASTTGGVRAYSLNDPAAPVFQSVVSSQLGYGLAVDDRVYVQGGFNGELIVTDRTDNSVITLPVVAEGSFAKQINGIVLSGNYAFVATQRVGLQVADLSDPDAPVWVKHIPSTVVGQLSGLTIAGDRIFLAGDPNVSFYDISDPSNPVLETSLAAGSSPSVSVAGDHFVLATDLSSAIFSGAGLGDSFSTDTDTISIDIADLTPPVIAIDGSTELLRGDTLTITSNEAGTAYLVKRDLLPNTFDGDTLAQLEQDGDAIAVTIVNGKAQFATTGLLGEYVVLATDAAGNVTNADEVLTIITKPVIGGLSGNLNFTEGDAAIAVAANLTLTDDDSVDTGLASAQVKLGSVALDAAESLSLTITPVSMGALTATYVAATGTLSITGTATLAQWQAALRAVTYSNESADPVASRSVSITVVDVNGNHNDTDDVEIDIEAVDNPPVFNGAPGTPVNMKVGSTTALPGLTIVDPDTGSITITVKATEGDLSGMSAFTPTVDGYTFTGTVAQVNTALAQVRFTLTGADGKVELSASYPDNDDVTLDYLFQDHTAPVVTISSNNDDFNQGTSISVSSDEDGAVYLVRADALTGTLDVLALAALVSDGKAVKLDLVEGEATFSTDTLLGDYKVVGVDGAGNVSAASRTLSVVTAPEIGLIETTLPFTEGGPALAVAAALTLTDADDVDAGLAVAYVRIKAPTILIGGSPVINLDAAESLALEATIPGLSAAYDADTGILEITGTAALAQWQAALRAVVYRNTSKDPVATREIEILVADGREHVSTIEVTVDITAVNNEPVFVGVPGTPTRIAVGTPVVLEGLSVEDPDSSSITVTVNAVNGTLGNLEDWVETPDGYTYTGSASAVSEALAKLSFTLTGSAEGYVSLSGSDGSVTLGTARYVFLPPVAPAPGGSTTPVDGVPVQIGTGSDGQQQIVVPVVTDDRNEDTSTANSKLADITLVKTVSGTSLLNLGIPVGTGVTANGPGTPVSGSTAQTVLDGRITAADGSAAQKTAAQGFLSSLDAGTQVVVQTITISAQATSGGPLVISAGNTQDGHRTAVIIDTRALPAGTLIDLENVDFAIIVGDARVTGGAGANIAYGDDNNQFIVLGEGDDILHGLGGNDTVGSLRGNDQTFGDDGDDVVYGGTGDDILHGGNGNDRMNGGFGFDTGVQSGVLADYTVTLDDHTVVLTHKTSGEVDRFLDVEHITFDSGTSIVVAHEASDVAALTARFADAQLIELNANRAVAGTQADDEITPELGIALNIDLGDGIDIVRLAGGRSDVHIDVEAGQRAELTRLEDGAMLAFNNVELLAFANGDVTVLAHNHEEAVVGRAYELLLGRNVDTGGYKFWIEGIDQGVSLNATLTAMMQSPEFTGASLTNSAFLDLLYTTGFDRTADASGKAFWLAALDSGVSRAQVLEGFAASGEAVAVIGSTIDVTVVS
ncbi:DUF4214 domain-containing protein [Pigmentiphaga aceris]|uniref:DUF4214 domain-containing protein n=1 Tax=Pigmentiphaga aceris TaxID=1940612 RepID=A0A5C0AW94_9BURK|nr:DUF4214 domain-containing protein [Pigmentiphaga aceris]QEI04971.1 DUF4214 domain-containing protein [Pigmentiphaga aceris]